MPEVAVFNKKYKPKNMSSLFNESGIGMKFSTVNPNQIVMKHGMIGAGKINLLQRLTEVVK